MWNHVWLKSNRTYRIEYPRYEPNSICDFFSEHCCSRSQDSSHSFPFVVNLKVVNYELNIVLSTYRISGLNFQLQVTLLKHGG